jgi:oxalate decarboxylase
MTAFAAGEGARSMDFQAGDIGDVQQTPPHDIENTGDADLKILEMIKSGVYGDLSLSMANPPPRKRLRAKPNIDRSTLCPLAREETAGDA